jgi:hypothetical protein
MIRSAIAAHSATDRDHLAQDCLIATGPYAPLQAFCPPAKSLELLTQGGKLRVIGVIPSYGGPH